MSVENTLRHKSVFAQIAPNSALVLGHVVQERSLVREHLVTNFASRIAQVKVQVISAMGLVHVRPVAHTAMEPLITFHNVRDRNFPRSPNGRGRAGLACKCKTFLKTKPSANVSSK